MLIITTKHQQPFLHQQIIKSQPFNRSKLSYFDEICNMFIHVQFYIDHLAQYDLLLLPTTWHKLYISVLLARNIAPVYILHVNLSVRLLEFSESSSSKFEAVVPIVSTFWLPIMPFLLLLKINYRWVFEYSFLSLVFFFGVCMIVKFQIAQMKHTQITSMCQRVRAARIQWTYIISRI